MKFVDDDDDEYKCCMCENLSARRPQLEFCQKWQSCAYDRRKSDGGEGVSKCVTYSGDSVFAVQFV